MAMHSDENTPTLEAFLAAPVAEVAAVAPATMVFAAGGTRRDAILNGVDFQDYFGWTMDNLISCSLQIFDLGVRHLFVSIMRSTQIAEQGDYGAKLWQMARHHLGDPARIERLRAAGIRVRCFGAADVPHIGDVLTTVEQATANGTNGTWWWGFAATPTSPWDHALARIGAAGATTHAAAVRAVYGEDVPPVGVYLAFGKPFFTAELIPPLLEGEAAAFWYQQPGYTPVTESLLRRVFYEWAYLRRTWHADKTNRYGDVLAERERWLQPLVLGLGQRHGPFWYPQLSYEGDSS